MSQPSGAADPVRAYLAAAVALILAMPEGQTFVNADVLATMHANGWPDLPEPRSTGSMLLRLNRDGYIEKIRVRSSRKRSHGGVTSEWRRTRLGHEPLQSRAS